MNKEEKIQVAINRLRMLSEKHSMPIDRVRCVLGVPYSAFGELLVLENAAKEFSPATDYWGGKGDSHAVFYADISVPSDFQNARLYISCPLAGRDGYNPQFTVWVNGTLQNGFDMNHTFAVLSEKENKVLIYAYTGMAVTEKLSLSVQLAETDTESESLYYDMSVPFDVLSCVETYSTEYAAVAEALSGAVDLIDFRKPHSEHYNRSLKKAAEYLKERLYSKNFPAYDKSVLCVGHTHIDIAWLWTYAQTEEKVVRSFSTAMALLERYPEYRFMSSQALLYDIVKRKSPELFEKIVAAVKTGRWEVEGAAWVEPDCNIPSGESLIRQILYGKKFFSDEFGVDCKTLWLPDVFGYSAALPQIMQKCGIENFFTSKISWNDTNQMPYDIFNWRGIDGTEVLTYFLTAQKKERRKTPERYADYVGHSDASWIAGTYERLQQKDLSDSALLLCGYGDGGGGTTHAHIEGVRRLSGGLPSCPPASFGTVTEFFDGLRKKKREKQFPKWCGELYLEYHRGTYTTQSKIKRLNRKKEYLLQQTELLSVLGKRLFGFKVKKDLLDGAWKLLLKNQFHDILPGSSIREVYDDSERDFERIEKLCSKINDRFYGGIIDASKEGFVVFNPHGYAFSGNVRIGGDLFYVENIPAKGYKYIKSLTDKQSALSISDKMIENKYYKIIFDDHYQISSVYDKENKREVFISGQPGNQLIVYEDAPLEYDAWELKSWYGDKSYAVTEIEEAKAFVSGASGGIRLRRRYMDSVIAQTIRIYAHTPRIDFETEVDWKESNALLKAVFPIDVSADKAVCDIQFGNAERSTHRNTSWDAARYEVSVHKFADISEGGYGVAVMNDCKYGYSLEGTTIGVSLLRSPTWPDKNADKGKHNFTYALYPHAGGFTNSDTVRQAFDLNNPLYARKGKIKKGVSESYSLCACENENVILETVKPAEDGEGIVIRLYETKNIRTAAKLHFSSKVAAAAITDCLERHMSDIALEGNFLNIDLRPYEIITLKILLEEWGYGKE